LDLGGGIAEKQSGLTQMRRTSMKNKIQTSSATICAFILGGAQYRYLQSDSSFRPNPEFNVSAIPPSSQLDQTVATLGPRVTRDSRSDINYPREGSLLDFHIGLGGRGVGGQVGYQIYDLFYNKYFNTGPGQRFRWFGLRHSVRAPPKSKQG
jgi:outer membrane protein assembly factor BamA